MKGMGNGFKPHEFYTHTPGMREPAAQVGNRRANAGSHPLKREGTGVWAPFLPALSDGHLLQKAGVCGTVHSPVGWSGQLGQLT